MEKEHHVPTWDGQAKSWRRYTRVVCWFVRSTPVHKRKYVANRLMSRLTGPARLLAMSWTHVNFDHGGGTKQYLRLLANSPLVRRSLPNAAAICQQYFSFRRSPGEAMHSFLVRESLGYSEFVEAIIRLYEEKHGVVQHEKDFGLPDDPEDDQDTWWNWEDWEETDPGLYRAEERRAEGAQPAAEEERAAQREQAESGSPQGQYQRVDDFIRSQSATPERRSQAVQPSQSPEEVSELSLSDSFVLGVLRGFRLLQAAGLSPEDKRDILGTTRGSLEFETVTQALQTLWDEQFLGKYPSYHANMAQDSMFASADDDWWGDDHPQEDDWSYDQMWASWDDWSWDNYGEHYENVAEEELHHAAASADDDPAVKEALQAERVAEQLAAEAHRSWSEAQRATQALRKDRGFGHVDVGGKSGSKGPCWICWGPHLSRDCPDRRHPSLSKGYSKGKGKSHYMADYEAMDHYFIGKGKSKGKKGKQANWLDAQIWQKGKKGKGKNQSRPSVNAYHSGMFAGGLEMMDVKDANTSSLASSSKLNVEQGLIDCGATASAGPLVAVESLISSVLAKDRQAVIDIQKSARPYFRFGNGQWGRALFRATISSNVSGSNKSFQLFALPNPPDLHHPDFDRNSLVPVLVGMDHLGSKERGMSIDFPTGLAMDSSFSSDKPKIYQLPSNQKGHYVLDIVHYLTHGKHCLDGHAVVRVSDHETTSQQDLHVLQFNPVEFYDMSVMDVNHDERHRQQGERRLMALHTARCQHFKPSCLTSAATAHMYRDIASNSLVTSQATTGHGVLPRQSFESRSMGVGAISEGQDTGQGWINALRPREDHERGSQGSKDGCIPVAVLSSTSTRHMEGQRTWKVASLQGVQSTPSLRAKSGVTFKHDKCGESFDGDADASGDLQPDRRPHSNPIDLQGCPEQDRCRGDHEEVCRDGSGTTFAGSSAQISGQGEASGVREQAEAVNKPSTILGLGDCPFSNTTWITQQGDDRHGGADDASREERAHGTSSKSSSRASHFKSEFGKGLRRGGRKDVKTPTYQPLQPRVAAKVMLMAAALTASLASDFISLCVDGGDAVWEIACSPHSWLSQACEKQGLPARRINLAEGYDIYRPETWESLKALRRVKKPKKIWFSLPCTKFCRWTYINYSTPERKLILKRDQRKERKMLWCMDDFVQDTLTDDPDCHIYFEWTFPCLGWSEPPMIDLHRFLCENGHEWLDCRIDGCNYGMMDSNGEHFIKKKWLVKTTDPQFHHAFKTKVCPGGHQHSWITGQETARSAYYPWKLVESIARHWKSQWFSSKHLKILCMKEDHKSHNDLYSIDFELQPNDLLAAEAVPSSAEASSASAPSDQEIRRWEAKIAQFHKAAGHPTNANLARLVKNAG